MYYGGGSPMQEKYAFFKCFFLEENMFETEWDEVKHQQSFLDKLTEQEYLYASFSYQNGSRHYRFTSVESGEPLLPSEKGHKIRFDKSPDIGLANVKKLCNKVIVRV